MCKNRWDTLEEFVNDPELLLEGYQAAIPNADKGLLLFTHTRAGCSTTLSLYARDFRVLYDGPHYTDLKYNSDSCQGYCSEKNNLKICTEHCRMNWVRVVLQILKSSEYIKFPPNR
ncbi:hypothetical protein K8I28_17495 [bacterium]|nr:hypothetical protein [bacterium]